MAAWTSAHDTNLSVLRLQNVYGPGQSLTNSYTGIVALFARLARQQSPLEVYEDGRIVRDFVYIDDVVEALFAAVQEPAAHSRCLDIGSGIPTSIHELAQKIAAICDAPEPIVVAKFRDGDVRAAKCDIEPAKRSSTGVPSGRSRTDCMHCLTGSAGSPNCIPSQMITPMCQSVPQSNMPGADKKARIAMKFALASFGTRGDIEPSVAVGREFLRRGHEVRMAVSPELVDFVESAGLAAVAYGPDTEGGLDALRNFWSSFFRNFWKVRELTRLWGELWEPAPSAGRR